MKQRPGGNAWARGPPVVAGHPARTPARMTAAGLMRPAGTTTEPRQRPVRSYRGSTWKCPGRPVLVTVDRAQLQNHNSQRGKEPNESRENRQQQPQARHDPG